MRVACHAAGSYDKETNTGSLGKTTMRFDPEAKYEVKSSELVAHYALYCNHGDFLLGK